MTEEPRSSRAASLGYRWTHQPATARWRESLPSLMMSISPLKARSGNQKRGRLGGEVGTDSVWLEAQCLTGSWCAMKVAGLVSSDRVCDPSHALAAAGTLHTVSWIGYLQLLRPLMRCAVFFRQVPSEGWAIVICVLPAYRRRRSTGMGGELRLLGDDVRSTVVCTTARTQEDVGRLLKNTAVTSVTRRNHPWHLWIPSMRMRPADSL
jgi:hypothetical protein